MDLLALLLALLAGVAVGLIVAASRTAALRSSLHVAELALERGRAGEADLALRQRGVDAVVGPLHEQLGKVERQLRVLETDRARQLGELSAQVGQVKEGSERLGRETAALASALRRPQARGRWGELQLRRVVEHAGMLDRCDFEEQVQVRGENGLLRPDLLVRLPGDRCVVVDAKVSLTAYLEAAETEDERVRMDRTTAHARHLRAHVDRLADKRYWQQFPSAPEFVVLFLPGEALLGPALEADPTLLEHAYERGVHLATPTTLVTLLRAVAHGWRTTALAHDAQAVLEAGRAVHLRLATLAGHVDKLGRSLNASVSAYNATVGSLERSLLPSARRMADLGVTGGELDSPREVDDVAKPVTAPALLDVPGSGDPPERSLAVLPRVGL
ncbi:MAG TPA: DNA recombination protein RmuC [Mycobacteriales bacterium]|jgi:DNA recombination protein RmuC|nr:DNA recombination protein RmuC [Mycobacteriales bacterium]